MRITISKYFSLVCYKLDYANSNSLITINKGIHYVMRSF